MTFFAYRLGAIESSSIERPFSAWRTVRCATAALAFTGLVGLALPGLFVPQLIVPGVGASDGSPWTAFTIFAGASYGSAVVALVMAVIGWAVRVQEDADRHRGIDVE